MSPLRSGARIMSSSCLDGGARGAGARWRDGILGGCTGVVLAIVFFQMPVMFISVLPGTTRSSAVGTLTRPEVAGIVTVDLGP
jgi:hypothetical protein